LERRIGNVCAANAFSKITVIKRSDLPNIQPPAIAYVQEDGNYYLKYCADPIFESTPYYSKHVDGWHPLDVSSPRWDRPIHIIDTEWVIVNGFRQDLDLLVNAYVEKGLSDHYLGLMDNSNPPLLTGGELANDYEQGATQLNVQYFQNPIPIGMTIKIGSDSTSYKIAGRVPSGDPPVTIEVSPGLSKNFYIGTQIQILPCTDLGTLPPGDFIFRIGRENMSNPFSPLKPENNCWYITSTECTSYLPSPAQRRRKCWNVNFIGGNNPPARFDRVIHVADSEKVDVYETTEEGEVLVEKDLMDVLMDQKKVVPGDVVFDNTPKHEDVGNPIRRRRWDYLAPKIEDKSKMIPFEFARELTVMNKQEFMTLTKYFQFTRIYIINMTHGSQAYTRQLPTGVDSKGNVQWKDWSKKQHPAELCYWGDYD
jgi:hypothetical protein